MTTMRESIGRLLAPWRDGRLGRAAAHVTWSLPIGVVGFCLVVTGLSIAVSLLAVALLGVPVAAWTMSLTHHLANVERRRVEVIDGRAIDDPVPPLRSNRWLGRIREQVSSRPRWREIAYAAALMFPATAAYSLAVGAWAGSLALTALPLAIAAFPGRTAHFWLFDASGATPWGLALVGVVGLVVIAPWLTVAMARGLSAMARGLLGPGASDLTELVARAESTRVAAVDAAEAERRRIERDLHDGAQQRLVALAANLGAAREHLERDPDGARELVVAAHDEAKGALREIRDLVRGIHPVILEDRGLDAALSAVVARCPVPVSLDVRLEKRLPSAVESAAYFVISEALTNVATHAHATAATVTVARSGDHLVVEVRDDGVGGADPARGTGLQGLRDRITGLHGTMHVLSPPGGPTIIGVELPCGS